MERDYNRTSSQAHLVDPGLNDSAAAADRDVSPRSAAPLGELAHAAPLLRVAFPVGCRSEGLRWLTNEAVGRGALAHNTPRLSGHRLGLGGTRTATGGDGDLADVLALKA